METLADKTKRDIMSRFFLLSDELESFFCFPVQHDVLEKYSEVSSKYSPLTVLCLVHDRRFFSVALGREMKDFVRVATLVVFVDTTDDELAWSVGHAI